MTHDAKLLPEGGNEEPLKASSWLLMPQALGTASLTACGWAPGAAGAHEQPLRGAAAGAAANTPQPPFRACFEPGTQTAEMIKQGSRGQAQSREMG